MKLFLILGLIFSSFLQAGESQSMLEKPVGHIFDAINEGRGIPPSQRLHLILLGVNDVKKSVEFYESLGWKKSPAGYDEFVKIDLGGYAIILFSRKDFAKDAQSEVHLHTGFSGIGFVYLTKTPEEVPEILERAVVAGGTLVKPATRTPWGIAGYFKDPDGHLFEVNYEKVWVLDEEHRLIVDELNQ